jgi:Phosphotransferase enzyme family
LVVRVGDTVHRPQTEGSAAVHDLLLHLETEGFEGAPRYLGQDEQGREILSYLEGEAAIAPHPAWAFEDDVLVSVARLLRRYHAAVRTFDGTDRRWASSVPTAYRERLVSHNDPNLDNVVFRDGEAVALLDFDLASPGSALWDVAVAARLWVPLRDPSDVPDGRASRMGERLRVFVDAYGLSPGDRARLAEAVVATHAWCYDIVRAGADRGQAGYSDFLTTDAAEYVSRGSRWLASHESSLRHWLAR